MRRITISIVAGMIAAGTATVAHASGYDPKAADRYTTAAGAFHDVLAEPLVRPRTRPESKGFHPFSAQRYTATVSRPEAAVTKGDLPNYRGFKPFSAHRYTR